MKPRKHSLLFSVLALTLACLLFNASVVQAGLPVVPIIISFVIGLGGGVTLGWWLTHQDREPGVTAESYVRSQVHSWKTQLISFENYVENTVKLLLYGKFYFVRVAEYQAKNYVNYENLEQAEDKVMQQVAEMLHNISASFAEGLTNFGNELRNFAINRLTGDLNGEYLIFLGDESVVYNGIHYGRVDWMDSIIPVVKVPPGEWIKVWIFDKKVTAIGGGRIKLTAICTNQTLSYETESDRWDSFGAGGLYRLEVESNNVYIDLRNILIIEDSDKVEYGFVGISEIHFTDSTVKNLVYARYFTITTGSLNEVEVINLDDVFSGVEEVIHTIDNIYDEAFNYAKVQHQLLRSMGYTDPSKIPPDLVLPPPDVVMPTVEDLYKKGFSPEQILAAYLAYLKQLGKAFNETSYKRATKWTPENASFADVREKLLNVIIKDIYGRIWAEIEELIPIWLSEVQEFKANMSNILKGVMAALVKFKNGTWAYVEIPANYTIIPQKIVTPNGVVPTIVLQNYRGGLNPAYPTPTPSVPIELTTPASDVVIATMQVILALLPLILILAVVNMISSLGRRR